MNPLISAQELSLLFEDPNLLILDVSQKNNKAKKKIDHEGLKIKQAIAFDINTLFDHHENDMAHMTPDTLQFQEVCCALGINKDSKIVVYDNLGVYFSPRTWWLFKTMGHENISVLDGGLNDWFEAGGKLEKTSNHSTKELGDFRANYRADLLNTSHELLSNLKIKKAIVSDARSPGRFKGIEIEPRENLKSGHIPNSLNFPFVNVLENGRFKSKKKLQELIKPFEWNDENLIFTCGSGVTACIILMACELAGIKNHKALYDGAWIAWGQGEFPVATEN
jgi:thiosulfate/3-mercaptopyruvate sulfurtransferase